MAGLQIVRWNLKQVSDVNPELIYNDIIFEAKAAAVPYNYRISYKISLICLIIGKCCGKKGCSAIKLQMINAAILTSEGRRDLLALAERRSIHKIALIRFDPAISRAINFALSDDLIFQQGNGLFRLSEKGKQLLNKIYEDPLLMVIEKDFFRELSSKLTEELIDEIAQCWRGTDA